MRTTLSIFGWIIITVLAGCGYTAKSDESQKPDGGQSIAEPSITQKVPKPFPGAKEVRLFVEKEYASDGKPVFTKLDGRPLTYDEWANFEDALRIEKAPEGMDACFIPHHFFRYYDELGKQIGEFKICFCCEGIETSEGAQITLGSDQILGADYIKLKALVVRLGEPTDVNCD